MYKAGNCPSALKTKHCVRPVKEAAAHLVPVHFKRHHSQKLSSLQIPTPKSFTARASLNDFPELLPSQAAEGDNDDGYLCRLEEMTRNTHNHLSDPFHLRLLLKKFPCKGLLCSNADEVETLHGFQLSTRPNYGSNGSELIRLAHWLIPQRLMLGRYPFLHHSYK